MFTHNTYYLWSGIEMSEMLDFMRMLCESCYSFNYDYTAGEVTVCNITDTQLGYINDWIREADLKHVIHNIHEPY